MNYGKKINLINMNKVFVEFKDIDGIREYTRIKGRCKKFGHNETVVVKNEEIEVHVNPDGTISIKKHER